MKLQVFLATLVFWCVSAPLSSEPERAMCLCKFVAPRYSAIARQAVIQGTVHIQVDVSSDGKPEAVNTLDQANQILGESAATAVKNWRFCSYSGKGKSYRIIITFIFKLEGEATQKWAPTNISFDEPATVVIATPSGATLQPNNSSSSK